MGNPDQKRSGIWFITLLFVFSGLSGIIYEVVWVRLFGLVFGNTVFASSTVLSVFMGGLALGSWLFGNYVDRQKNPLTTYIYLEIGIGLFGLLAPLCIQASTPLYVFIFKQFHPSFYQISIIRLIVSFCILILPCTLMGGTLPVLSKFISGAFKGMPEKQAGRLYAVNTFGAVLGCLLSGYFLIGAIGLIATTAVAVIINFAIAAALFIYSKRLAARPAEVNKKDAALSDKRPEKGAAGLFTNSQVLTVIILYALSGFLSLFLEVVWTRALVWVMGMDTYAFASMLSVFLCGLALGSFLVARLSRNMSNAIQKIAVIELLIGISVLVSTVLIKNMYGLMHGLENNFTTMTFLGSFVFLIAIAAAVMGLPTLFMGMAFPLAFKVSLNGRSNIGAGVGAVYAANTIGSVFGALLAGFIALPLIGVMKCIVIAGGFFLMIGAVLFVTAWEYRKAAFNAAAIGIAVASFVLMVGYAPDLKDAVAQGLNKNEQMLYFKETITGDVQVGENRSRDYGKILRIDGRQVASDGQIDVVSHKYPAHLMEFLKDRPNNVLFIAFGAGGTAGSLLRYDDVERLDAVEICGGVFDPARRYFTAMNNGVMDDPRLNLIVQDGRNFVRLTEKTYDIIYSGPIHPQSNQGSAALYSKDFFQDCRKRLNRGGIQCIWLPMHMPPEDYKVIVKSFQEVYPHSSLWLTTASPNTALHSHLIGSTGPLAIDYGRVEEKLRKGAVVADQMDYISIPGAFDFIGQFALGEGKLREFTSAVTRINTDNLPFTEFYKKIGRKIYRKNREYPAMLLADIVHCKESGFASVVNVPVSEQAVLGRKLEAYCKGDSLRLEGHISTILCNVRSDEKDVNGAIQYYQNAYRNYSLALNYLPMDRFLSEFFADAARMFSQNNEPSKAPSQ